MKMLDMINARRALTRLASYPSGPALRRKAKFALRMTESLEALYAGMERALLLDYAELDGSGEPRVEAGCYKIKEACKGEFHRRIAEVLEAEIPFHLNGDLLFSEEELSGCGPDEARALACLRRGDE